MFLSSWMTYQRRREREKLAAAKIEAKYAVISLKTEKFQFKVDMFYFRKHEESMRKNREK